MGEKTNSWFFSVLFRCSGKVDNEYSWSRATLLSALIPATLRRKVNIKFKVSSVATAYVHIRGVGWVCTLGI